MPKTIKEKIEQRGIDPNASRKDSIGIGSDSLQTYRRRGTQRGKDWTKVIADRKTSTR